MAQNMYTIHSVTYFFAVPNENNDMWNVLCFQQQLSAQQKGKIIGLSSLDYGFSCSIEYKMRSLIIY